MPKLDNVTIRSVLVEDPHPTPHYLGVVMGRSGVILYTNRPRLSRASARRDARQHLRRLAADPDFPLAWL